jgi:MFS family permease
METRGDAQKDFFYGWVIVFIATLAMAITNGLTTLGIAVFSKPIREEFVNSGIVPHRESESMIAAAGYLTFLLAGFIAPLAGFLIRRFGLKLLMIIGCVMLGAALLLHSRAHDEATIYAARILMGISLGFVGVMPNVVLVSNWFKGSRGTALGIAVTGTSMGGVIIPLIATPLVIRYDWRIAMMLVSLLVWLVLLPAVIFLVKERPDDVEIAADEAAAEDVNGFTLGRALLTPVFWVLALCAAAIFYSIFMTTQQFILYLETPRIGVVPLIAGYYLSILFAVSIAGKFFFGWLSDKFPPQRVILICCAVMFLATLILLGLNAGNAIFFIVLFGFGYGGSFALLQILVAEFFGRREYGKILGLIVMIEMIGAAVGGKVTGYFADADGGDYKRAFYGVMISTGFALLLSLILNRKRKYLTLR